MKQKIKEALKQGHKKLGVSDEVFERVAASVETFITDESQIAGFVASENTLNLLKSYQSMADKIRDLERTNTPKPNNEPNPQGTENGNQNTPNPNPNPEPPKPAENNPVDMAKVIADAVAAAIKPLSDELTQFKGEQAAKSAFASAEATFKGNDYVKKYSEEATDAWERATEMYEATGKSWTAEQLQERAMGYFNKAVAKKGVDTSKPFDGDKGGNNEPDLDMEKIKAIYRKSGRIAEEKPQV